MPRGDSGRGFMRATRDITATLQGHFPLFRSIGYDAKLNHDQRYGAATPG